MQHLIEELIRILRKELMLFEELHKLVIGETEAYERMDNTEIISFANQKETIGLKIKALEESRIALIDRLGGICETNAQELCVSRLAQCIEEPLKSQLQDIASKLKNKALSIKKLNTQNRLIAEYTLSFFDFLISQLQHSITGQKFYYQRNKLKSYSSPGQLMYQRM